MVRTLQVKVRDKRASEGCSYKNEVDMSNPSMIAIILKDLETMFDAPIQKACKIILEREKTFPFS